MSYNIFECREFKKNSIVWKLDVYVSLESFETCLRRTVLYGNVFRNFTTV